MRYFAVVLGLMMGLLSAAAPAQADTWWDYMDVRCDPAVGVFTLRDVRRYDGFNNDEPNGELIGKTKGATYETNDDGIMIPEKDMTPELASCAVKVLGTVVNFSVRRTDIDGGRVMGQCGAANSAEITLFADDKPIAIYPSAKDECFTSNDIKNHPRVQVLPLGGNGIEICENVKLQDYGHGETQLRQRGEICRSGHVDAHADFLTKITAKDSFEDEDLYPVHKISARQRIIELGWINERVTDNLEFAEKTLAAQEMETTELKDQLREAQETAEALQTKLDNPPKRGFGTKFRDLFSRD